MAPVSAVVFAIDGWTSAYAGESESLLRRYLDNGGRVVWLGHAPGFFVSNEEGQVTGVDRSRPAAILDVDHSAYNTAQYGTWPTEEGRARGLTSWWVAGSRLDSGVDVTVLASNEVDGTVAWLRSYAGGGEFIQLYATGETRRLDEIRAVTEYGLFRSPDARDVEAAR